MFSAYIELEPSPEADWVDDPVGRIALWTEAELPAQEMLRTLAGEHAGRTRRGFQTMASRVEQGASLEDAYRAAARQFPRRLARQLGAAAQSGSLTAALPAFAANRISSSSFARTLAAAAAYPLASLVAIAGVALLFSLLVAPQFKSIMDDFQLELPVITEAAFLVMDWMPWILGGLAIAFVATLCLWPLPGAARLLHWLATALPLLGRVWVSEGHRSFSQQMASFTAAGLPLHQALRTTAGGLEDQHLAATVQGIADRCEQGEPLADAMAQSRHFERPLTALIGWGEERNALPHAFTEAGAIYESQVNSLTALVRRLLPPLLSVVLLLLVALLVTAMFLPLISLISNLSG